MSQLLITQYEYVKGARGALFGYCESIDNTHLFKPIDTFNNCSIADLLVHNVNTYISWINNFGLDANQSFYKTEDVKNLDKIKSLFDEVNVIIDKFIVKYNNTYDQPLTKEIIHKKITVTLTPLQLFTHVITHEFHHKGQILTMSRTLGYIPVDTDVIRTSPL